MNLFDRDYTQLSDEERTRWSELRQEEIINVNNTSDSTFRRSRFREYPKAVRHFQSTFPNNYLDIVELRNVDCLSSKLNYFRDLLDSENVIEQNILKYVREQRAHFIIGSLLRGHFPFGRHEACLFPEFRLGNSYRVDYLLAGKNSSGWHFVFIELEAPRGRITLADGRLGEVFRKGIEQTEDWVTWLDAHYSSLSEEFERSKKSSIDLPSEFYHYDRTRIHFIIIAGRRNDFSEKTYQLCRKNKPKILIHYDNLLDSASEVIGKSAY